MYNQNADQRHKIRTILYIAAALLAFGKTKPYGQHYGAYRLFLLTSRRSRTLDKPGFFWYNYCAGKIPGKTRVWRNWQTHQISSALPHCIYPATARQEIRAEILRACGEIGRHDGFRFHSARVGVQVPSGVPPGTSRRGSFFAGRALADFPYFTACIHKDLIFFLLPFCNFLFIMFP